MKFKVGDRVRVKDCFDGLNLKGKIGTVIGKGIGYDYAVEFDERIKFLGHNCDGLGKRRHCRYGNERELEPVFDKKIVITSDGKTTLARLYEGKKVVKSAEAKCDPGDTFDFTTGARIAFERLTNTFKVGDKIIGNEKANRYVVTKKGWIGTVKQVLLDHIVAVGEDDAAFSLDPDCFDLYVEPKYYSGKVVCVESCCAWWTAGKIYEVVNGDIFDDIHVKRDEILDVTNLNDRIFGNAKFIELKE